MSNVNNAGAADEWFYASNGQQLGPVSMQALVGLVGQGQVRADTLVWTAGLPQWVAAGTRAELFPSASQPAATIAYGVATDPNAYPQPGEYTPGYPTGPLSYESAVVGQQYTYAGFWLRFCAAFLDGLITTIAGTILGAIIGGVIGGVMGSQGASQNAIQTSAGIAAQILSLIMGWLYEALMTSSKYQGTLGKMAVGIKVTDLNGLPIGFGRATGRHFAKILSAIILLIGYIMAAFTERRQALHDILAGCLVVKKGT